MPRSTSAGEYRKVGGFRETSSPSVTPSATFPVEETDAPDRAAPPTYGSRHATGVLLSSVPSGEGTPGERTTPSFAEGVVPVTPKVPARMGPAPKRDSDAFLRGNSANQRREPPSAAPARRRRQPAASAFRLAAGGAARTSDSASVLGESLVRTPNTCTVRPANPSIVAMHVGTQ